MISNGSRVPPLEKVKRAANHDAQNELYLNHFSLWDQLRDNYKPKRCHQNPKYASMIKEQNISIKKQHAFCIRRGLAIFHKESQE
jgi:hypothetical protein